MKSMTFVRPDFYKLLGYSETCSSDLLLEGDSLLSQGKVFEALESYNKSLCAAQLIDIPLIFERRSVVYFEYKEYKLCLDNIQLARIHGYPNEKIDILNNREEQCKKLMNDLTSENDPWNFFKLSYPPNQKIPFIVECLELHSNQKYGCHVSTTQG